MSREINDAPWVGIGREEYEERCALYDDEYEDRIATQAERSFELAREEEDQLKSRHEEIVFRVYDALMSHCGEANAISGRQLSAVFSITERKLRDIINEIRISSDFEKVIGSCTRGYFVCSSSEEVDRTNGALRHHALSELQVYWANERKAGRNGQGKIICGEDGKPFIESLARAE